MNAMRPGLLPAYCPIAPPGKACGLSERSITVAKQLKEKQFLEINN
jgi:hypothetical protein